MSETLFHTPFIFLSPIVSFFLSPFICLFHSFDQFSLHNIHFHSFVFFDTFTISYIVSSDFLFLLHLLLFTSFPSFPLPTLFIHSYLFRFIFIPVVCNSVKPFSQISLVSLKFTDAADNPSIFPFFLITSLVFFVLPFIIRMWPKCTSKFWPGTIRHCFLFFHSRHCKYWCYSACSF